MSNIPTPAMRELTAAIAKDERFAERLASLGGKLRRARRDDIAQTLFACSRQLRVSALNLRGRLAVLTPVGHSIIRTRGRTLSE